MEVRMTLLVVLISLAVMPGVVTGDRLPIPLAPKGNFPPYGKDLFNGHPTGRLSNGRLATDFIAEALGYSNVVRAFLDPTLRKVDLLHGVSFASAGSGYDDLTVNFSELHKLGARRLAVVGLSPFGCCPLVKTMRDITNCYDEYNQVALSFNSMIKHNLANLQATLGMQNVLIDIYHVMTSAITNPNKYGFLETSKGCCGTGLYEYSETCRGMSTCQDPSKYVFWDAAHPTQRMYEIIAAEAMKSIIAAYWAN
ncbi:GDSL-like Lipase/Acylhydrolase superfamily protein [Actinidia rufa]|uniref:GDSL-like Lipase/Acylhydrolase superfamily protein n=1 Tax=Actinidia rufa TaxID=165716 RepID=A0A7J0FYI7_9ERIC|nr:GDSL-like Lipase/Acylhydrolase superfamily protein [Actinidia rufa]